MAQFRISKKAYRPYELADPRVQSLPDLSSVFAYNLATSRCFWAMRQPLSRTPEGGRACNGLAAKVVLRCAQGDSEDASSGSPLCVGLTDPQISTVNSPVRGQYTVPRMFKKHLPSMYMRDPMRKTEE